MSPEHLRAANLGLFCINVVITAWSVYLSMSLSKKADRVQKRWNQLIAAEAHIQTVLEQKRRERFGK